MASNIGDIIIRDLRMGGHRRKGIDNMPWCDVFAEARATLVSRSWQSLEVSSALPQSHFSHCAGSDHGTSIL